MQVFEDGLGRKWTISLNIGVCKRVKDKLGFDLLAADEHGNALIKLASDFILLADVLWAIVEPQAEKDGISAESFIESLSGDSLDEALNAFAEAFFVFFPGKRREIFRKMWGKIKEAETNVLIKAEKEIEAANLGEPSTKSLDVSASSGI